MAKENPSIESLITKRQELIGTVGDLNVKLGRTEQTVTSKVEPTLGTSVDASLRVGRARKGLRLFRSRIEKQRDNLQAVTSEIATRSQEYFDLLVARKRQIDRLQQLVEDGYLSQSDLTQPLSNYQTLVMLPLEIPELLNKAARPQTSDVIEGVGPASARETVEVEVFTPETESAASEPPREITQPTTRVNKRIHYERIHTFLPTGEEAEITERANKVLRYLLEQEGEFVAGKTVAEVGDNLPMGSVGRVINEIKQVLEGTQYHVVAQQSKGYKIAREESQGETKNAQLSSPRVSHEPDTTVPTKIEVYIPEMPAEFGRLSRVDVGVIAGAIQRNINHQFLTAVIKESNTDAVLIGKEVLDALCNSYADTHVVRYGELDKQQQFKIQQQLRVRAFNHLKNTLNSPVTVLREIVAKDELVGVLLNNLSKMQNIEIEVVKNAEKPQWLKGMDAFLFILTEPEALRKGVQVKNSEGKISATVSIVSIGGEQRHSRLDTVVVTKEKSLDYLVALARGEKEEENKYSLSLPSGEKLKFTGKSALIVRTLNQVPEGRFISSSDMKMSSATVTNLVSAINADLEGTGYSIMSKRGRTGGYSLVRPKGVEIVQSAEEPVAPPVVVDLQKDVEANIAELLVKHRKPDNRAKEKVLTSMITEHMEDALKEIVNREGKLRKGANEETLRERFGADLQVINFQALKGEQLISGEPKDPNTTYTLADILVILSLMRFGTSLKPLQRTDLPRLAKRTIDERR